MDDSAKFRAPNTRRRSENVADFPASIDITRFREVGRIRRPSQAASRQDYDDRVAILDELYDRGNLELLEAFRDGLVDMDDLVRFKSTRRLDTAASDLALDRPYDVVVAETLPRMAKKDKTREGYLGLLTKLKAVSVPRMKDHTPLRALARLDWKATQSAWFETGAGAQTWINLRTALGSLLTKALGDVNHRERKRILDEMPAAAPPPGRVPDATVEQVLDVIFGMPRKTGAAALTMLLFGLREDERNHAVPKRNIKALEIAGREKARNKPGEPDTKNAGSQATVYCPEPDLLWPLVEWSIANQPAYVTLRRHWCQRCHEIGLGALERTDGRAVVDDLGEPIQNEDGTPRVEFVGRWPQTFRYEGLRLHDLRHFYGQWIAAGGAPLNAIMNALRVRDPRVAGRYIREVEKRTTAEYLAREVRQHLTPELLWPATLDDEAADAAA